MQKQRSEKSLRKADTPHRRSSSKAYGPSPTAKADLERRNSVKTPTARKPTAKLDPLMQKRIKTPLVSEPGSFDDSRAEGSSGPERKSLLGKFFFFGLFIT